MNAVLSAIVAAFFDAFAEAFADWLRDRQANADAKTVGSLTERLGAAEAEIAMRDEAAGIGADVDRMSDAEMDKELSRWTRP